MKKKITAVFLVLSLLGGYMPLGYGAQNNENQVQQQSEQTQTLTKEEIKTLVEEHYDDLLKIIKKEKPEISCIEFYKKTHLNEKYGYTTNDNGRYHDMEDIRYVRDIDEQRGRTVVPLCDGDYAVWNAKNNSFFRRIQYAVEYHKDGSLFGVIKIRRISRNKYAFYEYRLNEPENGFVYLKHVLVYYKTKNPVTFVTTADGKIRGIRYKDEIVYTDLSNLADIDNLDLHQIGSAAGDTAKVAAQGAMVAGSGVLTVLGMAGAVAIAPIAAIIMIPTFTILSFSSHEEDTEKNKEQWNIE